MSGRVKLLAGEKAMTFHEWFAKQTKPFTAAEIWKVADTLAREECATLCDQLKHSEAWECAEEIRKTINGP
jgi:hypothetical protein